MNAEGSDGDTPAVAVLFLVGLGLLWFGSGLLALMGMTPSATGPGLLQATSVGGGAAAFIAALLAAVFVCIAIAWRGRWWGWTGLLVLHGGLAIIGIVLKMFVGALAFGAVALVALVLFASTRPPEQP